MKTRESRKAKDIDRCRYAEIENASFVLLLLPLRCRGNAESIRDIGPVNRNNDRPPTNRKFVFDHNLQNSIFLGTTISRLVRK